MADFGALLVPEIWSLIATSLQYDGNRTREAYPSLERYEGSLHTVVNCRYTGITGGFTPTVRSVACRPSGAMMADGLMVSRAKIVGERVLFGCTLGPGPAFGCNAIQFPIGGGRK